MQEFQIQILNKLRDNPGSLTYGEFHVVEGLVKNQIKNIDPTERFIPTTLSSEPSKFHDVINCLIAGIIPTLIDLHVLQAHIRDVKMKQLRSNQLTDFGYNPHNPSNFKSCVGGNIAAAMPMTMEQYNYLQNWTHPVDKDPKEKGYLILLHTSTGEKHPEFGCPITWVPESRFELEYRTEGNLTYSDALLLLKRGDRIMRSGWNGKNMFVELRAGFDTDEVVNGIRKLFVHGDYTVIVNLNNNTMSVWVPSPTDHLAEDWSVFTEED